MKQTKHYDTINRKTLARKMVDEGVTAEYLAGLVMHYPSKYMFKKAYGREEVPVKAKTNKHRTKADMMDRSLLWLKGFAPDTVFKSDRRATTKKGKVTFLEGPSVNAFNIIREFYVPKNGKGA